MLCYNQLKAQVEAIYQQMINQKKDKHYFKKFDFTHIMLKRKLYVREKIL